MKTDFTPIRTEYMGTVFDSKSEAVFARVMHILGHDYVYHPSEHCGHEWDFLVFRKPLGKVKTVVFVGGERYINPFPHEPEEKPILVEYKPGPPTKTYIENLTNKMRKNPFESVLVWGSPWASIHPVLKDYGMNLSYVCYPIFTRHDRFGWGDFCQLADSGYDCDPPFSQRHTFSDMFGCDFDFQIQAALKYRFDLRQA